MLRNLVYVYYVYTYYILVCVGISKKKKNSLRIISSACGDLRWSRWPLLRINGSRKKIRKLYKKKLTWSKNSTIEQTLKHTCGESVTARGLRGQSLNIEHATVTEVGEQHAAATTESETSQSRRTLLLHQLFLTAVHHRTAGEDRLRGHSMTGPVSACSSKYDMCTSDLPSTLLKHFPFVSFIVYFSDKCDFQQDE